LKLAARDTESAVDFAARLRQTFLHPLKLKCVVYTLDAVSSTLEAELKVSNLACVQILVIKLHTLPYLACLDKTTCHLMTSS
jgi:hypothetical protein